MEGESRKEVVEVTNERTRKEGRKDVNQYVQDTYIHHKFNIQAQTRQQHVLTHGSCEFSILFIVSWVSRAHTYNGFKCTGLRYNRYNSDGVSGSVILFHDDFIVILIFVSTITIIITMTI